MAKLKKYLDEIERRAKKGDSSVRIAIRKDDAEELEKEGFQIIVRFKKECGALAEKNHVMSQIMWCDAEYGLAAHYKNIVDRYRKRKNGKNKRSKTKVAQLYKEKEREAEAEVDASEVDEYLFEDFIYEMDEHLLKDFICGENYDFFVATV